jgi:hypothetical protein
VLASTLVVPVVTYDDAEKETAAGQRRLLGMIYA